MAEQYNVETLQSDHLGLFISQISTNHVCKYLCKYPRFPLCQSFLFKTN